MDEETWDLQGCCGIERLGRAGKKGDVFRSRWVEMNNV
jgi:hypothetical protein